MKKLLLNIIKPLFFIAIVILIFGKIGNALDATKETPNIQTFNSTGSIFNNIGGHISPIFTREVRYWESSIYAWASEKGIDPNLAATVMQIESCGDPQATSTSGAMGLFQVMPFHFSTTDNPYSPDTNANRGLSYLNQSLSAAGGDVRLALAGYNGGIGVISRGEFAWAAQTQRYVLYGYPIYQDASSGVTESSALMDWYSKYGVSLCRQASQRLGLP